MTNETHPPPASTPSNRNQALSSSPPSSTSASALPSTPPDTHPQSPARPHDHEPLLDDEYFSDGTLADEFNVEFKPRHHKYETVDFRTPTSKANLARYFPRAPHHEAHNYRALMFLAVVIGIVVAVVGFAIEQGVRGLTYAIYSVAHDILMRRQDRFWLGAFSFILVALLYVAVASALVVFVSPLAAGSGIPEIKSYLNGVRMPGLLRFRTLIAKAVGVTLSISGGLVCGKEGPMIHCGGIVAAAISNMASGKFSKPHFFPSFAYFRAASWKRDFTAIGAAAGVAVAFRAPLGGVLFVLEEAATHWSQPLTWATVVAASVAAFLSGSFHALAHQHFNIDLSREGIFSGPGADPDYFIADVPFYLVISVAAGVLGGLLTRVQRPITLLRYRWVSTPSRRFVEAMAVAAITSVLRILIPLAGRCQPDNSGINAALSGPQTGAAFRCPEGYFNEMASLVFQPMEVVNKLLLNVEEATEFRPLALLAALVFFFVVLCGTYGIAVPSGVFIPAFSIGSLIGRLIGVLVHSFWQREDFHIETYAFVGAIAGLAGITRMTMSVAVIALETTSNGHAFLIGLLVAWVAKFVGDTIDVSIYDLHIELRGVPILEARLDHHAEKYYGVKVRDIMSPRVIAVDLKIRVRELVILLRTHKHGSFPVIRALPQGLDKARGDPQLKRLRTHYHSTAGSSLSDSLDRDKPVPGMMDFSTTSMRGMIDRGTLLGLLANLHRLDDKDPESYLVLVDQTAAKRETQILANLDSDDLDRVLDLCSYTDPNPEMITEGATVAEAKALMRGSGARHALVVHIRSGVIVGIITRTDVLPEAVLEAWDLQHSN